MRKLTYSSLILFLVIIIACTERQKSISIEPAIYYWKTIVNPTTFEKRRLDSLKIQTVYLKFFDVEWNEASQKAVPAAKMIISDTAWLRTKAIIPTVFITNETLYHLDSNAIKTLSENVSQLISKYIQSYQLADVKEIQIDCDWTETTKNKYFYLLDLLKEQHKDQLLSATIRLHQLKYRNNTGIPPVKKGLLMCYNMGNLQSLSSSNSIIDSQEFAKYINTLSTYPISLDIGLPLFDWYVLFRGNKFAGLIQNMPEGFINSPEVQKEGSLYLVKKDTVIEGRLLNADDILRHETSDYKSIMNVVQQLKNKMNNPSSKVSFFHCDSITLSKYSLYETKNIFDAFR